MGVLSAIAKFVLDKDNQRIILLVLFAFAVIAAVQYRDSYKEQKAETQRQINNIEALQDSVTTYRNEAGELTSQKLALQTDKEQLQTLNERLAEEVEKEKGNVEQLTQIITRLRRDSVGVDTTIIVQIDPDTWKLDWDKEESGDGWYQYIEGYTQFTIDTTGTPYNANTVLVEQVLDMEITTGITEEDGQRRIFVRSSYPYLEFTDINGAILGPVEPKDNKRSRWGIGFSGGYGYSLGSSTFSPYIGIGVNYNLFEF